MAKPVTQQTATVTAVATGLASVTISPASAGAARIIVNDSAGVLVMRFGSAPATGTDYSVILQAGQTYYAPDYAYGGQITGILSVASGFARVTSY